MAGPAATAALQPEERSSSGQRMAGPATTAALQPKELSSSGQRGVQAAKVGSDTQVLLAQAAAGLMQGGTEEAGIAANAKRKVCAHARADGACSGGRRGCVCFDVALWQQQATPVRLLPGLLLCSVARVPVLLCWHQHRPQAATQACRHGNT